MAGFILKTLLNLVPNSEKELVQKVLTPKYNRSIDDITLPYLRPNNYAQPIPARNNTRYDITALVFIKTYKKRSVTPPHSIREANYWHNAFPFWNTATIKRSLWWKYFNEVTIIEAKQIIAREVMDKLYKDIYIRNEPIIGIRVVLFNGTTDEVINPKILRDEWFSLNGFNNFKIDRRVLNNWGIKSGYKQTDVPTSLPKKIPIDIGSITTLNLLSKFESMNIDLDELIKECFNESEELLTSISDKNTQYRIKSKLRMLLNGSRFRQLFSKFFVSKLRTASFSKQFREQDNRSDLIKSIISQVVNDFIDRELENK